MDGYFPASYEDSRSRFLQDVELLRPMWCSSRLESHQLKKHPDLSIDWVWLEPRVKENLIMISTAEHGVEGFVGSAVLKIFMDEFARRFDPEKTGLLLLHTINPWGMKHHLRVNPNHVDLNRNFIYNGHYDLSINPEFSRLTDFLSPKRPVRSLKSEALPFLARVLKNMIYPGRQVVQTAALLGQHKNPKGVYFGGEQVQEETLVLMELYRSALENYQTFLQMDVHTGYGPRYQMTIIIPPNDPIHSAEAIQRFRYPLVQKIDANEFYAISGDMGEYVYRLRDAEFPGKNVLAGGFEFGTFGNSLPSLIRSLRITILENQLRHHGAISDRAAQEIRSEYEDLFFPSERKWREKALADTRQAFEGLFKSYNLI